MYGQRDLERSARQVAEQAKVKRKSEQKKLAKRRRVLRYIADKWIDFLALIISLCALVLSIIALRCSG